MKRFLVFCGSIVVAAALPAQVTILAEDFEGGWLPGGWAMSATIPSVGWEFGPDLGSQFFPIPPHTSYAASNDDAHDDATATANLANMDYLVTVPMDLTAWASEGVLLGFSYVQPGDFGSVGTVEVKLGVGPWHVVGTVPPASDWTYIQLDLSAYTASNWVRVAFHHNDGGLWADGFAVDDVLVTTMPVLDAAMDEVLTAGYLPAGSNNLEGVVSNQGEGIITSVEVDYRIDGGVVSTGTIGGLHLDYDESTAFVHPVPALLPAVDTYQIEMWITAVNASTDSNIANDLATSEVVTLSEAPPKNVILTNHTGAWCGFCPDGYQLLEQALQQHGSLIGLSVHNGDAMAFPDGEALNAQYISGYPIGLIDIHRFPEEADVEVPRNKWDTRVGERSRHIAPVAVWLTDVSFDATTRVLHAKVQAKFFGTVEGDLRLNCWVVEDGVTGTGPGYDQRNYYNADPSHPYFGAGDPILGFVHDRTLRAMLGGTWGQQGIIPSTVADGDVYSSDFAYTVPAGYDETRIKLIGLVSRYDAADDENRPILNSTQESLWGIFADGFEWGDTREWTGSSP